MLERSFASFDPPMSCPAVQPGCFEQYWTTSGAGPARASLLRASELGKYQVVERRLGLAARRADRKVSEARRESTIHLLLPPGCRQILAAGRTPDALEVPAAVDERDGLEDMVRNVVGQRHELRQQCSCSLCRLGGRNQRRIRGDQAQPVLAHSGQDARRGRRYTPPAAVDWISPSKGRRDGPPDPSRRGNCRPRPRPAGRRVWSRRVRDSGLCGFDVIDGHIDVELLGWLTGWPVRGRYSGTLWKLRKTVLPSRRLTQSSSAWVMS